MLFDWFRNLFKAASGKKLKKRSLTDDEFRDLKVKREKKLNQILDKISKHGVDSLSTHEKNFLENIKRF